MGRLTEDTKLATAVAADTMHVAAPKGAKEWYGKYFGLDIGGMNLTFTESRTGWLPPRAEHSEP